MASTDQQKCFTTSENTYYPETLSACRLLSLQHTHKSQINNLFSLSDSLVQRVPRGQIGEKKKKPGVFQVHRTQI